MNSQELFKQICAKKSFLCVGLDTDLNKIPDCLRANTNAMFAFNKAIIDATAEYAVALKPNLAFYEAAGEKGLAALKQTVQYARNRYPDLFLIADAKRGDIGNTSQMYAQAFFEHLDFDAVTLSPYMGKDTVAPFFTFKDKWAILLALTSNPSAADFQTVREEGTGKMLYEKVIETSKTWGNIDNTMYVVGATKAEMLQSVREIVPEHFLLIPGVGAQGGSLQEVAHYGMNRQCGLLVNSSRAIIYADNSPHFAEAARLEARKVAEEMAKLLETSFMKT